MSSRTFRIGWYNEVSAALGIRRQRRRYPHTSIVRGAEYYALKYHGRTLVRYYPDGHIRLYIPNEWAQSYYAVPHSYMRGYDYRTCVNRLRNVLHNRYLSTSISAPLYGASPDAYAGGMWMPVGPKVPLHIRSVNRNLAFGFRNGVRIMPDSSVTHYAPPLYSAFSRARYNVSWFAEGLANRAVYGATSPSRHNMSVVPTECTECATLRREYSPAYAAHLWEHVDTTTFVPHLALSAAREYASSIVFGRMRLLTADPASRERMLPDESSSLCAAVLAALKKYVAFHLGMPLKPGTIATQVPQPDWGPEEIPEDHVLVVSPVQEATTSEPTQTTPVFGDLVTRMRTLGELPDVERPEDFEMSPPEDEDDDQDSWDLEPDEDEEPVAIIEQENGT